MITIKLLMSTINLVFVKVPKLHELSKSVKVNYLLADLVCSDIISDC